MHIHMCIYIFPLSYSHKKHLWSLLYLPYLFMQKYTKWKQRMENQTFVTEFILLGFPSLQRLQVLLFVGVLVIYILTVTGNIIIVVTVVSDNTLHKPMYFFLENLSCLGIIYVSTTIPKLLASLLDVKKSISIAECKAQAFSHFFLGATEFFL